MELLHELSKNSTDWAVLSLVTFCAATIQSAIGFGFGLIAVSFFLVILHSVEAIQLVIIITLVMSCVHWFSLREQVLGSLLLRLSIGCAIGFPAGIYLYSHIDVVTVTLVVASVILVVSGYNLWHIVLRHKTQTALQTRVSPNGQGFVFGAGVISGVMASSLAMPGPAVMLYLSRSAFAKDQIRATIVAFFIFSYAGALLLQLTVIGIGSRTWLMVAVLTPMALVGVAVGHRISSFINVEVFKILILLTLLLTGLFMIVNLLISGFTE